MTISATTQGLRPGVCTSTSRPSVPFDGQVIYETDTDRALVWNGASWTLLGPPTTLGLASANWYMPTGNQTNVTPNANTTYYVPFYLGAEKTFDRIMCRTHSTWTGSTNVRLGVYNNSNGAPTTVAFDAGQVSCSAASTNYTITINQTLAIGWYWFAFNAQGTTTGQAWVSFANIWDYDGLSFHDGSFSKGNGWAQSSVTGAFATATGLVITTTAPAVGLRVS